MHQEEKKAMAEEEKQNALKGIPSTLKLLPPSEADAIEAKKVCYIIFNYCFSFGFFILFIF